MTCSRFLRHLSPRPLCLGVRHLQMFGCSLRLCLHFAFQVCNCVIAATRWKTKLLLCTYQMFIRSSNFRSCLPHLPSSIHFAPSSANFHSHLLAPLTRQSTQEDRSALSHSTLFLASVLSCSPSASSARGGSRGRFSEENYSPAIRLDPSCNKRRKMFRSQGTELTSDTKAACLNVILIALIEEDMLCGWSMMRVLVLSPNGTRFTQLETSFVFGTNFESYLIAKSLTQMRCNGD